MTLRLLPACLHIALGAVACILALVAMEDQGPGALHDMAEEHVVVVLLPVNKIGMKRKERGRISGSQAGCLVGIRQNTLYR